jgi:hypothetical protein
MNAQLKQEGVSFGDRQAYTSLPAGTKLKMQRDRVLVRVLPWKPSSIIDVQYHGRDLRGEVVAIGPGRHPWVYIHEKDIHGRVVKTIQREAKHFERTELKPGDIVELGGLELRGYAFARLMIGNVPHIIIQEADTCFAHGAPACEAERPMATVTPIAPKAAPRRKDVKASEEKPAKKRGRKPKAKAEPGKTATKGRGPRDRQWLYHVDMESPYTAALIIAADTLHERLEAEGIDGFRFVLCAVRDPPPARAHA